MSPSVTPINFAETPLAGDYSTFYATIIDNAFTPEECQHLLDLAQSDPDKQWMWATRKGVESQFRHNERILRFDRDTANWIFERLKPLVEEDLGIIEPKGKRCGITGKGKRKGGLIWKLKKVNERLSFLRYQPGDFFKHHCDGSVEVTEADGSVCKAFVTLHLYLNEGFEGGATRFWTPDKQHHLDVEAKIGRVLVFQQRQLWHTGEEVREGVKYTMRSDFMFESSTS